MRCYLHFYYVDICFHTANFNMKLLVPRNKKRAVEPSRGSSHRIYHNLVLILKIYQLNLRIFWRSSKNHWFLLNNDPYIHIFLILCVWMKYNGFLRGKKKSTCAVEFQHELLFLFKKKKNFLFEKNDWQTNDSYSDMGIWQTFLLKMKKRKTAT